MPVGGSRARLGKAGRSFRDGQGIGTGYETASSDCGAVQDISRPGGVGSVNEL